MTGFRDALHDLADEAAAADLAPRVARGVRRRRQRRAAALAGAAAVLVAGAVVVSRPAPERSGLTVAPSPSYSPRPVASDAYDVLWVRVRPGLKTTLHGQRLDGTTHDFGRFDGVGPHFTGALSPDGEKALLIDLDSVFVLDLRTGGRTVLDVPVGDRNGLQAAAWAPDSRTVAIEDMAVTPGGGRSPGFYVADVTNGGVRRVAYRHDGHHLAWSPDGTMLALTRGGDPDGVSGFDVVTADGRLVRSVTSGWLNSDHAWSPDGRWLLLGSDTARGVYVADAVTGAQRGPLLPYCALTWRDPEHVACQLDNGPVVTELSLDGQVTRRLAEIESDITASAAVRPAS
jgi:hypothetical protein